VVVVGEVGDNFGAGFTGGVAFVYDPAQKFERRVNAESILWQRVATPYWEGVLKLLVERHAAETQSRFAATMLNDWERESPHFWQVVPKDYVKYLASPLIEEVAAVSA
jgi:glutamate synthase (NADPH/NADH) large chain